MSERMLGTSETAVGRPPVSRLSEELSVIVALWRRDMLHLVRERSRWLGVVFQPLLFWAILGSGMSSSFRLAGAEQTSYLAYFFPGTLVMILLFTTIFAIISVIEDRQSGFLQGVMVAPGSRMAMVLGKTAGVTTLALAQSAIFLMVSPFAGFPLGEVRWLPLIGVLVLGAVGLTAINFAMAWRLNSSQAYHALMSIVLLPLWVLSGAMFPASGSWVDWVMWCNPMTYAVAGVREAMGGAGAPASLGVSTAVLAAFAGVGLAIAIAVSRAPAGSRARGAKR